MRERITRHRQTLGLLLLLALLVPLLRSVPGRTAAYIEPSLRGRGQEQLAVIVSAGDSAGAAQAVARVGGTVTSDLWLIDGVAARIPAGQVAALAASPGVRSVVENKGVQSTDWQDRASERRVIRETFPLEGSQKAPVVAMPDGGFVSVQDKGQVLIVNADGTERARLKLNGGSYSSPPIVSANGTIYVAGENRLLSAINPDGSLRWEFIPGGSDKFLGSPSLGADGTVYVASDGRWIYALDGATGAERWRLRVDGAKAGVAGSIVATPTVGPFGNLYVATTGDRSKQGHLFAISPAGQLLWTFVADLSHPFQWSPLAHSNGMLYIASTANHLYGVDLKSGARHFTYVTGSTITAPPTLAADGSLFVVDRAPSLYGIDPDGTTRFRFRPASGTFPSSPVLSPDGATLYVAGERGGLYAIDATTGSQRWRHVMEGYVLLSPAVDGEGTIAVASTEEHVAFLKADGRLIGERELPSSLSQTPAVSARGEMAAPMGSLLVEMGPVADKWNGRPDVQEYDKKLIWKLVNPVGLDLGVDTLHETTLPDGNRITGAGITVAVVDSGIYFDREVRDVMGNEISKLFKGQHDFVNATCPTTTSKNRLVTIGTQREGYCEMGADQSVDGYGHGTVVAGIIWSNLLDFYSNTRMGIAPEANLFSVRVLNDEGYGTYETVIKGIQHVVQHKELLNVRVMNLSLSATATTPYFVDPLNRAVEQAWAQGIVVVAAAGNSGPGAQSITVPGNDPYVITVGALQTRRTPGYWADDTISFWSASGPTMDGFVKPDVVVAGTNIVSFMYNDPTDINQSQKLVQLHPDYSQTTSLFRMNGTSMSTAIASGVVALMLQVHPQLMPDQVKFRLMYSAHAALGEGDEPLYSPLQQGAGRIWAREAVLGALPTDGVANQGMDIQADLAHGWETDEDLAYHYQGSVQRALSDDGQYYIYYATLPDGSRSTLGFTLADGMSWVQPNQVPDGTKWSDETMTWDSGRMTWAGGLMTWAGGRMTWAGGRMTWAGGRMTWAGGLMTWAGGRMTWAGGRMTWAGGTNWANGSSWTSDGTRAATVSSTSWIDER